MLAKKYRLPAAFFKERRALVGSVQLGSFRVRAYFSSLPYSRFACTVSNAAFPNIVRRNLFRRRVYDAVRIEELFKIPGKDFVITLARGSALPDKRDIQKDLSGLREHFLS